MLPPLWQHMQGLLHKYQIELSPQPLGRSIDKKLSDTDGRLDSEKLSKLLNYLYDLLVAIFCYDECRNNFLSAQSTPTYGSLVSTLLDIFGDSSRDSDIRLNAARCLKLLVDVRHKEKNGDTLAAILPGFLGKCQRIALDNANAAVSYQVPQCAIQIIGSLLCCTMCTDSFSHEAYNTSSKSTTTSTNAANNICTSTAGNTNSLEIERDNNWYSMAASKIFPQLSTLVSLLCSNNSHHIRLATLMLMKDVTENCSSVFGKSELAQICIDLCAVLLRDPHVEVQKSANDLLTRLRKIDSRFVLKYMSQKLSKMLRTFPRSLKNSSSGIALLQNLTNCLLILGTESLGRLMLASSDFVNNLVISILSIVQIEKKRLLISASGTRGGASFLDNLPLCYGIRARQLSELAEVLAGTNEIDSVFNSILDNMRSCDIDGKIGGAVLIIMLASTSRYRCSTDVQNISLQTFVTSAIDMLGPLENSLEEDIVDFKIQDNDKPHSDESCLAGVLSYAIAVAVSKMTPDEHCCKSVIDVLYELLKWTSSPNYFVKEAASNGLELLANKDGFTDISDFLSTNASYIVFKISLRSRDFLAYPRSPLVLSEMLERCTNPNMFDQTRHIVDEFLLALDRNDQKKTTFLLQAIRSYIRALRRWYPELRPEPKLYGVPTTSEHERKSKPSPLIQSAVQVLNRTKHMISLVYLPIQLLVLDILDDALQFVRYFEDDLLPMIHQNWFGLVRKMNAGWSRTDIADSQKIVASRAVEIAETMCRVSGHFVYLKIVHELSPKILEYLQASKDQKECQLRTYPQTAAYRLQLTILKAIPTFVIECNLSDEHRRPLVEMLSVYANTAKLPQTLKDTAMNSLALCSDNKVTEVDT
ncbi:TELO2-interacting protein 1 like protein [Ditylenchus destructor]|nr:TELO2-interacting protein 1 like protein [Ditylenchus destructor]